MIYIGDFSLDESLSKGEPKYIICGAGKCGKSIYLKLKKRGIDSSVLAFCNDDLYKSQNDEIAGISVLSYADAKKMFPNAEYLVYIYMEGVLRQLHSYGIDKIHAYL